MGAYRVHNDFFFRKCNNLEVTENEMISINYIGAG